MPYFREDETEVQIRQLAVYQGDGLGVYGGCTIAWDEITAQERELNRQTSSPIVAADAWFTDEALKAMRSELSVALIRFHTSIMPFDRQAREYGHCAKSTWHNRLLLAHPQFWDHRVALVRNSRLRHQEVEANIRAASPAAIDLTRPFYVPSTPLEAAPVLGFTIRGKTQPN